MTTSYQNSYPGHLNISLADDDAVETIDYEYQQQNCRNRRQPLLLVVASLLFVAFLVFGGNNNNNKPSLLRVDPTALTLDLSGGGGDVVPKEEGNRVGSYWEEDFGDGVKRFFKKLFGPKTEDETETTPPVETPAEAPVEPEVPVEPEAPVKKRHKKVTTELLPADEESS
jgi:hypothetical protein